MRLILISKILFLRKNAKKYNFSPFHTTVSPIIGLIGIGFTVILCALNLNQFLGTATGGSVIIVGLIVVYVIAALIYANWLQKNKPDTYLRIGRYDPENMSVDEMEEM